MGPISRELMAVTILGGITAGAAVNWGASALSADERTPVLLGLGGLVTVGASFAALKIPASRAFLVSHPGLLLANAVVGAAGIGMFVGLSGGLTMSGNLAKR